MEEKKIEGGIRRNRRIEEGRRGVEKERRMEVYKGVQKKEEGSEEKCRKEEVEKELVQKGRSGERVQKGRNLWRKCRKEEVEKECRKEEGSEEKVQKKEEGSVEGSVEKGRRNKRNGREEKQE